MNDYKHKVGSFIKAKAAHGFHYITREDYVSLLNWGTIPPETIKTCLIELDQINVIELIDDFDGNSENIAIIRANIPVSWMQSF